MPLTVTDVVALTAVVVMPKLALVAPAVTVTLAGTLATVLLLDSVTTTPLAGAAEVNVTVPVLGAPPTTLVGLRITVDNAGVAEVAVTVNAAVRVTPPKLAEIDRVVEAATVLVVIVKVALVAPGETVTLAGTVAAAVLALLRLTMAPLAGAAALSVTVPCDVLPPTTDVGVTLRADKVAAGVAACTVNRRTDENGPAAPAEFRARTRQKSCWAGRPVIVARDALTVWLDVIVAKLFEVEIWMR